MKNFAALTEQEILALAISLEEEDERVYADYSEGLRSDFPATAAVFDGMRLEEIGHRRRLIELYRAEIRRAYSPHPAPGRERLCAAAPGLAGAPASAGNRAQPGHRHGRRDSPFL